MNTTFLIGNGFDICLGLDTRYYDFYTKHYLMLPKDNLLDYLKTFREEIQQYVLDETGKEDVRGIDWSDLEKALGQYSSKLEDPTEYINIVVDVNRELRAYIKKENERFQISQLM